LTVAAFLSSRCCRFGFSKVIPCGNSRSGVVTTWGALNARRGVARRVRTVQPIDAYHLGVVRRTKPRELRDGDRQNTGVKRSLKRFIILMGPFTLSIAFADQEKTAQARQGRSCEERVAAELRVNSGSSMEVSLLGRTARVHSPLYPRS
jgi:hypothetical protein